MRIIAGISVLLVVALTMTGCDNDDDVLAPDPRPASPQGVVSITGDGVVHVLFNGIYDNDVNYYNVYRSREEFDNYSVIGTVDAESNPGLDLILYRYDDDNVANGVSVPYFYAVTSVDFAGQQSALSAESVFDTPRPEGEELLLSNDQQSGSLSGFNFATGLPVYDTSSLADIYIDLFQGIIYLNIANDTTDIQDMGYTDPIEFNNDVLAFDNIGWAPTDGWSELGYVEVVEGHTYVIWTGDRHYAKLRIYNANPNNGLIEFNYAYQPDVDNPELSIPEVSDSTKVQENREKAPSAL
jgi:hypothetical protein